MVPASKHTSTPSRKTSPRARRPREVRPFRHHAPRWAGWLIVGCFLLATVVSLTIYIYNERHPDTLEMPEITEKTAQKGELVAYPGRTIDYARKFNYQNATHLKAAKAVGVNGPLKDQMAVNKQKNKLVRIGTTKNYKLDDLDYSLPYLTPKAAKELDAIAADFADILQRNGLPHYRPIVTSVLRTQESVRRLQKSGNINSTTNSAHCYGTTFDITYKRFDKKDSSPNYMSEENLKLVLAQALLNEQRAGHIYVKYEFKQACFHITCR